jgi:dipeptidyl aminopeptidase/acylaminoacyl peptidase
MLRRHGAVLVLLLPVLAAAADAQPRAFTADDIIAFKSVVSLAVAPDARSVAVSLRSAHPDRRRFETDLWLVPLDGGAVRQLTFSPGSEGAPAWAPDGSRIAFIARRGEVSEVHVLPLAGGEARPFTAARAPVASFSWAPDGKRIAMVAPPEETNGESRQREHGDDAAVAGRFRNHRVWIATDAAGARALTDGRRHVRLARWSPDGRHLAVISTPTPEADSAEDSHVELIEAATGRSSAVVESDQATDVAWSPDGRMIAIVRPYDGRGISRNDAFVRAVGADRGINLSRVLDRDVEQVFWRGRDRIDVLYSVGTTSAVSTIDVQTGSIVDTWAPGFGITELAPAGDGFVLVGGDGPDEVRVKGTETRVLTQWNSQAASALQLPTIETIKWRTATGSLEGVLLRPAQLETGRRYPVIVNPHGGPRSHSAALLDAQAAFWVSEGFLVFKPNFRGSTGYGDLFARANVANWGDGPFRDVQSGIDHLVLRGIADPTRLFMYGWSYGGYLANWAITHGEQFRAVVSGAGVADLRLQYAISDARRWRFDYFTGTPFNPANMPVYERESPVTYARAARTPTLFIHGEDDERCPLVQGVLMYRALQDNGTKTELVVYPRERHGFTEPRHIIDRARRALEWFRAHDPATSPAQRRTTAG